MHDWLAGWLAGCQTCFSQTQSNPIMSSSLNHFYFSQIEKHWLSLFRLSNKTKVETRWRGTTKDDDKELKGRWVRLICSTRNNSQSRRHRALLPTCRRHPPRWTKRWQQEVDWNSWQTSGSLFCATWMTFFWVFNPLSGAGCENGWAELRQQDRNKSHRKGIKEIRYHMYRISRFFRRNLKSKQAATGSNPWKDKSRS